MTLATLFLAQAVGADLSFGQYATIIIVAMLTGVSIIGLAVGLFIGWLIWPCVTPFGAVPRHCLKCRYDFRAATSRTCPECGCDQSRYRLKTVPVLAGKPL